MQYVPSTLVAPATVNPADLAEFKVFLRQDNNDEDTMLEVLLAGAVGQAEDYLQIALAPQTRQVALQGAPSNAGVKLDYGPITAITSVTYVDLDEVVQTVDPADYFLEGDTLYAVDGWPTDVSTLRKDTFKVRYTASLTDADVSPPVVLPAQIKAAVWLFGQVLYDRNERVAPMLQKAAERLLDTWRVGQGV